MRLGEGKRIERGNGEGKEGKEERNTEHTQTGKETQGRELKEKKKRH